MRFSGTLVAGLSLLSPSIMRLKPSSSSPTDNISDVDSDEGKTDKNSKIDEIQDKDGYVDLFLPPRSLYVLSGSSRYHYTHELLESGAIFRGDTTTTCTNENDDNGIVVERQRRISVIFRDAKA